MTSDHEQVKKELLAAAMRLFADRGMDDVSVREIAAEAGVTHGSIRYHFGTKQELYIAALTQLGSNQVVGTEMPTMPPKELLPSDVAEEQLVEYIHRVVEFQARIAKDKVAALGLFRAEVSRDGGPDPVFFKRVIRPSHEHLKWLLRSIRNDIDDDEILEILAFNIIFQCVMFRIGHGTVLKLMRRRRITRADTQRVADLIASVTLDGLRAFQVSTLPHRR